MIFFSGSRRNKGDKKAAMKVFYFIIICLVLNSSKTMNEKCSLPTLFRLLMQISPNLLPPVNDIGKICVYVYIYDGGPAKWEMMSVLLLFKDANKDRYKNK